MDEENKPDKAEPDGGDKPDRKDSAGRTPKPGEKPAARKPVKKGPSFVDLDDDDLAGVLRETFPDVLLSAQAFLDQSIYTVAFDSLFEVMDLLRRSPDCRFDYLVDLTALDYLGEAKRFCMVYHLFSHETNRLIRVKSRFAEPAPVPTMTPLWKTANWLEREVYDMFGIQFYGHPDLRRILLPDDWHGFPLRKDYDIKLQDQAWIKSHLRIRKVPE
jgi:NADH-quinone oxidoreductase subunit C